MLLLLLLTRWRRRHTGSRLHMRRSTVHRRGTTARWRGHSRSGRERTCTRRRGHARPWSGRTSSHGRRASHHLGRPHKGASLPKLWGRRHPGRHLRRRAARPRRTTTWSILLRSARWRRTHHPGMARRTSLRREWRWRSRRTHWHLGRISHGGRRDLRNGRPRDLGLHHAW